MIAENLIKTWKSLYENSLTETEPRKRTPEQIKTFFKRETTKRGEGRELYKTPEETVDKIVSNILQKRPDLKKRLWIDPCAGDGIWEKVFKKHGLKCKSYDIHPLSNNIEKQDFFKLINVGNNTFICGNPPYSMLKEFVNHALEIADSCYFLGGSQIITGSLSPKVSLLQRFEGYEGNQKDRRSKLVFEDTNGKNVLIWTCGAIFDNRGHSRFKIFDSLQNDCFRVGVLKYCQEDNRVEIIKR